MRKRQRGKLLMTAALTAVVLAGCGKGGEPQVIDEKQETTAQQQTDSSEDSGTDGADDGLPVRDQVQAPERYQADVTGENLILTGDAPVTVPQVKAAGIRKADSVNYTEEEYSMVKKTMAEVLNLEWTPKPADESEGMNVETGEITSVTISEEGTNSQGNKYNISYRSFKEGNVFDRSLIWVSHQDNYGKSSIGHKRIYQTGEEPDGQPAGSGAELEEKAEKLINDMGFEDYRLYKSRWRESDYQLREKQWTETEYRTIFTPVVEGIHCTKSEVNLFGNFYLDGPYIEVGYKSDGTLEELKIIGKNEVISETDKEDFLLPFEAVHQLFEQYCIDFFDAEAGRTPQGAETSNHQAADSTLKEITTALAHIKVKDVKLEYACLKDSKEQNRMNLIPVWNFYGSIEKADTQSEQTVLQTTDYWTARKEPDGLILSIRADDGQIMVDSL